MTEQRLGTCDTDASNHAHRHAERDDCERWRPLPVLEPSTPDKSRCSLCGCTRIPLNREKTKFGACTFIECKNPTYDLDRERAAAPQTSPRPIDPDEEQRARNLLREMGLDENLGRIALIASALKIWRKGWLDALEEYWKSGCSCEDDSVEVCELCQRTQKMLEANGRLP